MKKYIIPFLIIIISFCGCKKFLSQVNSDPNQFNTATPAAILQGCFKSTTDFLANDNMSRWWDLGHLIWNGQRYDLTGDNVWQPMYVNVLEGITQIKNQYGKDSNSTNQVQIARIWESYAYYILVANYGPVAKSQANQVQYQNNIIYDNEDTVYRQILDTLKDAASKINVNKTSDVLTYDVVGGGNLTKWIKFANTLRLEIALNCRRNLGSYADQHIKDVMSNDAMTVNAESESLRMPYENVTNNQNPYYIRMKLNSYTLSPPVMSDFLFIYFRSYQDPRLNAYFDSVPARNRYLLTDTLASHKDDSMRVVTYRIPHFGRPESTNLLPGWSNLAGVTNPMTAGTTDTTFSHLRGFGYGAQTAALAANSLVGPSATYAIMTYAQSEFLKAEAAQLGLGGSQSAQQYYQLGIAANFAYWGLTQQQLTNYMNMNGVQWNTAGSGFYDYLNLSKADIPQDNLTKIWIQSWINFFPDQAFEVWNLQRRTRVLNLPPMTNPGSAIPISTPYMDIPDRTPYPSGNSKLNPVGFADAMTKLGIPGSINDWNPYVPLHFMVPFTVKDWNAVVPQFNMAYVQKWYGNTIQSLDSAGVAYTILSTYHP